MVVILLQIQFDHSD